MRRVLFSVVAVAGLLASLLAVAAAVAGPVSAQTSALTLTLVDDGNPAAMQGVTVSVAPAAGCDPGARAGLAATNLTDAAGGSAAISTGLLNNACNWVVSFTQLGSRCAVEARLTDGGAVVASGVTGALRLAGNGAAASNSPLRLNGDAESPVNTILFTVTDTCHTAFNPELNISVPAGTTAGTTFAVTFAPTAESTNPACTQSATVTAAVNTAGAVVEVPASRNVMLIHDPVTGADADRCIYAVTFPAETGVLRLSPPDAPVTVTGPQGNAANTAAATYVPITVDVVVTTTYPADQVFSTADKATYEILVEAPCGGYISPIPSEFGRIGDSSTVQVFPGTVTVYAPALGRLIVPGTQTFTTNAFNGANANQPCTITVTESGGPDHCQAVGGDSQTVTYSAGLTAMSFAFTHTCVDPAAGDGNGGDGSDPDLPPTPPSIDLGGSGTTGTGGPQPNTPTG